MPRTSKTIALEDEGVRLDRWFRRHMPEVPYVLVQKLLRKGVIRVDGKKANPDQRLLEGQQITIPHIEERERTRKPARPAATLKDAQKFLLPNIIYNSEEIMAINKPAGLAVQGGSGVRLSVDDMLGFLEYDHKPKLVHRIDKDTSGVLLLARATEMATILTQAFKNKKVKKTYLAVVAGVPGEEHGEIDLPLSIKSTNGKSEKTRVDKENGRQAITRYKLIEKAGKEFSLIELEPVTGRKHQLRVHMAEIGHPIVGDGKYGGRAAFIKGLANKMQLHAYNIKLELPAGKGRAAVNLDITAPLPPHMQESFDMTGFIL